MKNLFCVFLQGILCIESAGGISGSCFLPSSNLICRRKSTVTLELDRNYDSAAEKRLFRGRTWALMKQAEL